jgi:hypothetical protein
VITLSSFYSMTVDCVIVKTRDRILTSPFPLANPKNI